MARLHEQQVKALLAGHGIGALAEGSVKIADEVSLSLRIDDAARAPFLLLSFAGESGGEAHRLPICVDAGVDRGVLERLLVESPIDPARRSAFADTIEWVCAFAREVDATTLDVEPLAVTGDCRAIAGGCRLTIDDYAVIRRPHLGAEIALELERASARLERAAWMIDQSDDRGTLSFARLPVESVARAVGFHGFGCGGATLGMVALGGAGVCPANVTITGGGVGAAKVYAAARIILAQDGLLGYFASGAGVDSHEQHHVAYGLAKAFIELNLNVPALVRLGGNGEDRAAQALEDACALLPGAVEAYKKDHTPAFIATRFRSLVDAAAGAMWIPRRKRVPGYVGDAAAMSFPVRFGVGWEGACWLDADALTPRAEKIIEAHAPGMFTFEGSGRVALSVSPVESASRDDELIAAEIELARAGLPVLYVDIPIPGLDDATADGGLA